MAEKQSYAEQNKARLKEITDSIERRQLLLSIETCKVKRRFQNHDGHRTDQDPHRRHAAKKYRRKHPAHEEKERTDPRPAEKNQQRDQKQVLHDP